MTTSPSEDTAPEPLDRLIDGVNRLARIVQDLREKRGEGRTHDVPPPITSTEDDEEK